MKRLVDTEPGDVGLVAEASLSLGVAAVALRLFSLATLTRLSARFAAGAGRETGLSREGTSGAPPEKLAWAVDAASARLGGRCLVRSLALQLLLARRGIPGDLCVGFPRRGNPLPGHAWVVVDGRPLGSDGRLLLTEAPPRFDVLCRLPDRTAG